MLEIKYYANFHSNRQIESAAYLKEYFSAQLRNCCAIESRITISVPLHNNAENIPVHLHFKGGCQSQTKDRVTPNSRRLLMAIEL